MTLAKVVQERVFFPYTPYIESAKHFCEELTRKDYVSWHDLLAATTLLSLSVEAIANTIGELVVPDFRDFESSSPRAKIRIICETIGLEFDRNKSPFIETLHLLKIRNQLAHPKYQRLHYESKNMPLEQAQKHYNDLGEILHDIEKALSPEFAKTSLAAVTRLAGKFRAALDPKILQTSSKRLVIDGEDFSLNRYE
jgi:hypothetical protein